MGASSSPDGDPPTVTDNSGAQRNFSWTTRNTDITFVSGVASPTGNNNGVLRLRKVEVASIAVRDADISSVTGSELSVTVTPAGLERFAVVITSPQTNGVAFSGINTVTAIDSFGNVVTGFNAAANNVTMTAPGLPGTLSGLGSGGTNVLNQAGDFSSGVSNLSGKLKYTGTTGNSVFTATSQSGRTGSSGSVTINVGSATRLVLIGSSSQLAGASQVLTITAKDSSGNTVTTYTGDKTLVFSGSLPSSNPVTSPTVTNKSGGQVPFGLGTVITFTGGSATASGGSNGLMRLYRAATDTIAISDGSISSGAGDRLIVTVSADALAKFVVDLNTPQQSGIAFTGTNTITAQDSYGNTVLNYDASASPVTISANALGGTVSGLTPGAENILEQNSDFVSGVANLTGKLKYTSPVGTTTFTAVNTSSKAGTSGNVQIVAGGATRLVITGSATMTAGGSQNLTITARDGSGNVVSTYTGSKSLTFSGADSSLNPATAPTVTNSSGSARAFGVSTSITFSSGVATVSGGNNGVMRLYRAQTAIISVTDGTISSSGSDRLTVTVSAGPLGKFAWALTSPQTNGATFVGTNTLTAQDDWGNTRTTFDASAANVTITSSLGGTVSGLGTGNNNVLNRSSDFVSGVANLTTLGMRYTGTVGNGTFTATGGTKDGTSNTIQIVTGGATRLVLRTSTGDSITTMTAGGTRNLLITAKDGSGNTVTSYAGTKQLTFSGADSSIDPPTSPTVSNNSGTATAFGVQTSISFTNGVAQVSGSSNGVLRLYRAQTATVAVTDGSISSTGSDRLTATVSPGALEKFAWSLTSPQTSGVAFTGTNTLTARDTYGNTVTTFNASTSNVTLSTSLALPTSITGLGTGNNNILNRATDFSLGVANLTALGMTYTGATGSGTFTATASGKAGTSAPVVVTAGTATRLVITGATTQIAGAGQNLTITAKDASDNVVAAYTGTKNLTFSGANPSSNPVTQPTVSNASGTAVNFGTVTPTTFTNGIATVSAGANGQLKLYKVETATIGVTDGTVISTGADRLTVTVSPGALGQFAWTLQSPQVNGVNFTGTNTIVAQDDWGNIVPTFNAATNNVTITTSLPGSPGAITNLGSLDNNVLNQASDFTAGLANLTNMGMRYTGSAGTGTFTATSAIGSKTGLSGPVTINNPALTLTGITPAEASRLQSIMVTMYGTNFITGVTSASFGTNITVDTVIVQSPTQMTVGISIGSGATLGPRDVSVTNPSPGGATATLPSAFRVKNIPTLLSIAPSAGIRGQTYDVTITGTNFADGVSSVGVLGSNITINSYTVTGPTTIAMNIRVSPAASDGVRQFTVTNSGVEGGTSNGVGFTVGNNPVPTFTSISPDTATRLQTLEFTLRGSNFYTGISSVDLGTGFVVTNTVIDSSTQIRITVTVTDTASTGLRTVSVENAGPGGGQASLTDGLMVTNPLPTFTGLSLQNGSRLDSLTITLTGSNFVQGVTNASLGANITVYAVNVQNQGEMVVGFTIDSGAALGPRDVTVSNPEPGGGSATLSNAFTVNNPIPTIISLAPESTLVGAVSASLQVDGTNFVPGSVVRLGTLELSTTLVDRTRVTATIPASELDTARSYSISVFNPAPGGGVSNTSAFIVANPVPTLASIAPPSGSRLQTLDVVFTGTNFVPNVTEVDFGGSDIVVNSTVVNSGTTLTANITVQASATMGPRDVTVNNPTPGGGTSEKRTFTVAENPVPTIATVIPSVGARLGHLDVAITGTNFIDGVTSVNFGSGIVTSQPTITVSTQLVVSVTIDTGAATGLRSVSVTNSSPGGGTTTKTNAFTVINPVPTIKLVTPNIVQQLERRNIVIEGSGFIEGVTRIDMGTGITVHSRVVVSDTQITADITVNTDAVVGPRDISVFNFAPGGGSATLVNGFVVGTNARPVITSAAPATGKRLETLGVTIRGSNFTGGATKMDFGPDIIVNSVTVDSATRLTTNITISRSAATGPRTIYVRIDPPGGGVDSLSGGFLVTNPVPALASAAPSAATRAQTLNVVLRGANFVNDTEVNFGSGITVNSVSVDSTTRLTANITIGALATLGARNVVVSNPAPGGGNAAPVAFTVSLAPPLTPTLLVPTNGQPNLPTVFTARWDSAAGATHYHLQLSVVGTFSTTVIDDSTLTTNSRQIGPLVNNTTYYWHVRSRNAGGTSAYSSTWTFTPSYPSVWVLNWVQTFPSYTNAGDYLPTDYRLVGLPGGGTALVGNLVSGTNTSDWQAYWDNGAESNYFLPYDGGQTFTFSTGRAFWLVRKGDWNVNTSVPSATLDTAGNALVPLHTGWNIITNPFAQAVPWTAVQSVNGQATREPIHGFSGSQGFQTSGTLEPYKGFYFYNTDGVATLRVPYAATSGVLKQSDTLAAGSWTVGIGVSTASYSDMSTRLGIRPDAVDGLDIHDYHKPRAIGVLPSAVFSRPDMDSVAPDFATDFRGQIDRVARWPFELRAPRGNEVQLTFTGIGEVPSDFDVYLVDVARARYANVREKNSYAALPVTDRSTFMVLIGTHEAVANELGSIVPQTFALDQNFPNPFNPATTIPVSIPLTGEVTVKIYSILGEEVRTLHTGVLEQGRHWLKWDGRNETGRTVATGMYLTRMTTAAGGSYVIKMLLMK
jgi:hypothetical protein